IVARALLDAGVASQAIDLRPAGDAGLLLVPSHVARDALAEALDPDRLLGARADDAHLAAQHIHELRQLIERVAAQEGAQTCDARIIFGRPGAQIGGILAHAAKLDARKRLTVEADALLHEKDRPWRVEPDQRGDQQHHRREYNHRQGREYDVHRALELAV